MTLTNILKNLNLNPLRIKKIFFQDFKFLRIQYNYYEEF